MLPNRLKPEQFSGYPPQARQLATRQIALLQRLPVSLAPLLLREVIAYDWKFPAERKELDNQFAYLSSLSPAQLAKAVAGFAQLRLPKELDEVDWVGSPARFSEQLTAHLWASHQIDGFSAAAVEYMGKAAVFAPPDPLPVNRLGIVFVGQGVDVTSYPLFRKLRPHGVHYTRVRSEAGYKTIMDALAKRAAANPVPYGHWYIDGAATGAAPPGITCVSWDSLTPVRASLQSKMQKTYGSGMGPEAFRTMLAQLRPADVGIGAGGDGVLDRFRLSLLTEASGTQVFSTTFVQWAAREALRRAQPLTLVARFAPRQRERPMNELLAETQRRPEPDPEGSLVDADMGAYYTWLNQQRLHGAEKASFLVWFENHSEALAIGPTLKGGSVSDAAADMEKLLDHAGLG